MSAAHSRYDRMRQRFDARPRPQVTVGTLGDVSDSDRASEMSLARARENKFQVPVGSSSLLTGSRKSQVTPRTRGLRVAGGSLRRSRWADRASALFWLLYRGW